MNIASVSNWFFICFLAEPSNPQSAENKEPSKKRKRGPYCCVYGCTSCKGYDKIGFFKVLRKSSQHQTDAWRRAIRRENPDGSLWSPTQWSVICANHFIGDNPSNDRENPDYAPSQFLTHKPAGAAKSAKDCERHDRNKNRNMMNLEDESEKVDNKYW